jgi:C-terminal processing protease CtpA/Prc
MLLRGCTVDNTVVGGPAYNSRQLEPGDVILQVDGVAVTPASYSPPYSTFT